MTPPETSPPSEDEVSADALKVLRDIVDGMNLDNFIVRQQRRSVESPRRRGPGRSIDEEAREELIDKVAPLPSAHALGTEEAKRFDLLMFSLELTLLRGSKRFDALKPGIAGDRLGASIANRHPGNRAACRTDRGNPDRSLVGRRDGA